MGGVARRRRANGEVAHVVGLARSGGWWTKRAHARSQEAGLGWGGGDSYITHTRQVSIWPFRLSKAVSWDGVRPMC